MKVFSVRPDDLTTLEALFRIHDRMPPAWDPNHLPDEARFKKMWDEVTGNLEPHGFWVLAENEYPAHPDAIDGILWAMVRPDYRLKLVCTVASLWIRPEKRNQNLVPQLSEACIAWAKTRGATELTCATHDQNRRMRTILENQGFRPAMVHYTLGL